MKVCNLHGAIMVHSYFYTQMLTLTTEQQNCFLQQGLIFFLNIYMLHHNVCEMCEAIPTWFHALWHSVTHNHPLLKPPIGCHHKVNEPISHMYCATIK